MTSKPDTPAAATANDLPVASAIAGAWARHAEHVAAQQWPAAALYVVATPIGNLADLSLRALHALHTVDVIAAEDTRTSRALLGAWGIRTPLLAAHRHNEARAAAAIVERLSNGERVALISDAGAPAVSDPGARIVRAVRDAGHRVVPIPGASAAVTALMASGVTSDEHPEFAFAGFPPHKSAARQTWLRQWCALPAPIIMFESPHRVAATLDDLALVCGADRHVTIARELTKRFEEIATLRLHEASAWLNAQSRRRQGEFVLIVEAPPPAPTDIDSNTDLILQTLLEKLSVKDAARITAKITGASRDALYERAVGLRNHEYGD